MDETGKPDEVSVSVSSGSSMLDALAAKDAAASRYRAGTLDGRPTRVCGVRLVFRYSDSSR